MERCSLKFCNMQKCCLVGTAMLYSRLEGADLSYAEYSQEGLSNGWLMGAKLGSIDWEDSDMTGARLTGCDLSGALMSRCDLTDANLENCNTTDAEFYGSKFDINLWAAKGWIKGSKLSCAGCRLDWSGMVLKNSDLSSISFNFANLEGTDLSGSNLDGCNFTGASLRGANLSGCSMKKVLLTDCDLYGANTEGVELGHHAGDINNWIITAVDHIKDRKDWPENQVAKK